MATMSATRRTLATLERRVQARQTPPGAVMVFVWGHEDDAQTIDAARAEALAAGWEFAVCDKTNCPEYLRDTFMLAPDEPPMRAFVYRRRMRVNARGEVELIGKALAFAPARGGRG